EPVGRHVGVPDRVLNVLVPEVVLQGPRVVAIIGQLEPAGMAKHVRVDREWHLGGLPEALDEPVETGGADGPAALGNEHVGVSGGHRPQISNEIVKVTIGHGRIKWESACGTPCNARWSRYRSRA